MFNFVFDRRNDSRPYPNLAPMMTNPHDSYHGMGDTWPWIVPLRLLYFCKDHKFEHTVTYLDQSIPENAWYPVGIGFFDHSIDYFDMMSPVVKDLLKNKKMRVLFYYHEGDNPVVQQQRLDSLCKKHNLSVDCYRFISGNSSANKVERFVYFVDHELFYWRNSVVWNDKIMPGGLVHTEPRHKDFTALSRVHKWWRATVLSRLYQLGCLDNSYWSYNTVTVGDDAKGTYYDNNPIEIWPFDGLESQIEKFWAGAPYTCDTLNNTEHNQHWMFVPEHYENSYCNLVLETLYDADQSQGTFLSEKTFKPIRHGQPFILFGPAQSLEVLRSLGYNTFDHVLDNSYDYIYDNTKRFSQTIQTVFELKQKNLQSWFLECLEGVIHNQKLFLDSKYNRLNSLHYNLHSS
jgi:hypothetical protein